MYEYVRVTVTNLYVCDSYFIHFQYTLVILLCVCYCVSHSAQHYFKEI